ncbi:MAG: hypothetical protein R3321_08940 [Nitrososphaeraceae archaeon]|nr:hypothetical protein [Nitrososphaeraceae archaeon]
MKRVNEIASNIYSDSQVQNFVRVLYIKKECNINKYYFLMMTNKEQLESTGFPISYFYNLNNKPVFVYAGIEGNLSFKRKYKEKIKEITSKNINPNLFVNYHYVVSYLEFSEGKEVSFLNSISQEDLRSECLPFLIIN